MESEKWVGTASAYFPSASVEEMWAVVGEFCAADRWMHLDACYKGEGEENKPGCVRFCIAGKRWAKERLVSFEPNGHSYIYDVADNNVGIAGYSAAVRVIPPQGDDGRGCRVELSFESDPVEGWSRDGLIARLHSALRSLGKLFQ